LRVRGCGPAGGHCEHLELECQLTIEGHFAQKTASRTVKKPAWPAPKPPKANA